MATSPATVPIRTPLTDDRNKLTRQWILHLQQQADLNATNAEAIGTGRAAYAW